MQNLRIIRSLLFLHSLAVTVTLAFDLLWRDISPFAVGFDRTFDSLALLANSKQESSNYPPYNIRKVSEDKYTIELAVAGFEEEEIDIEASGENLVIKGSKDKDASEGLLHQGLASRNFVKRFVLSDDMVNNRARKEGRC